MSRQSTRRRFLSGIAAGAGLGVAGCLGSSGRGQWQQADAFPDGENRNRTCSIRKPGEAAGVVKRFPSDLGYEPYIYSFSGRKDLPGTNQHYSFEITADSAVRLIGFKDVTQANAAVDPGNPELRLPPSERLVTDTVIPEGEPLSTTWEIPDEKTYGMLFAPPGTPPFEITVTIDYECSYYLPFEEYQEQTQ